MFLHIGNHKFIREKEIIGIFDTDNATISGITRKFLADEEKKGHIQAAKEKTLPKSFILYEEDGGQKKRSKRTKKYRIYFSQISSTSLVGRSETDGLYSFANTLKD